MFDGHHRSCCAATDSFADGMPPFHFTTVRAFNLSTTVYGMTFLEKARAPNPTAPRRIQELNFQFLGPKEVRYMSTVTINTCDFYETTTNKPAAFGVLDLHLGTTNDAYTCQTCGQSSENCPGHFRCIELLFPVFNTGYYPHIVHILKCICKTCSHLLLTSKEVVRRIRRLAQSPPQTIAVRSDRFKSLVDVCKAVTICPHCGALNGPVKKSKSTLLINHAIGEKRDAARAPFVEQFHNLNFPDLTFEQMSPNLVEDLTPVRVLHLFDNIPRRELPTLMNCFNIADYLQFRENVELLESVLFNRHLWDPRELRVEVLAPFATRGDEQTSIGKCTFREWQCRMK
jgi:hypothetical protein